MFVTECKQAKHIYVTHRVGRTKSVFLRWVYMAVVVKVYMAVVVIITA